MRIAQIAPLTESVPPKLYGGTGASCPTSPRRSSSSAMT